MKALPKSRFKPKALEYLREVERTRRELVITDRGRPVVKIVPWREEATDLLGSLRGTLEAYDDPTEPVALGEWDSLR